MSNEFNKQDYIEALLSEIDKLEENKLGIQQQISLLRTEIEDLERMG